MHVSHSLKALFKNPEESEEELNVVTYSFKKIVLVTAKFTEWPTGWASVMCKVNDYILPYIATLTKHLEDFAKINPLLSNTFGVISLGETWNGVNYFLNGGAYEDVANRFVFSFQAQFFFFFANVIESAKFFKEAGLANTLGGISFFSLIKKGVQGIGLTAFPRFNEGVNWLSQEGWVNVASTFGVLADRCILGAFIFLGCDAVHRISIYSQEAKKREEKYLTLFNNVKESLKVTDCHEGTFKMLSPENAIQGIKLAKRKIKWLQSKEKVTQGKYDLVASVSESVLKGALMVGVANSAILATLGTFAFFAVGASCYYRTTSHSPDLESLL